jgi:hypothetical protein
MEEADCRVVYDLYNALNEGIFIAIVDGSAILKKWRLEHFSILRARLCEERDLYL